MQSHENLDDLYDFPDEFYVKDSQAVMSQTDQMTGVFRDPMDLCTQSRPWITPKSVPTKSTRQKKMLVVTTELNLLRDSEEKLNEAKSVGFKVILLDDKGSFSEWKGVGNEFKTKCYYQETIHQLVWDRYKLRPDNVMILDYLNFKKWMGQPLEFDIYTLGAEKTFDLIQTSSQGKLTINLCSKKFISQAHERKNVIPLDKVNEIRSGWDLAIKWDEKEFPVIFQTFTKLEALTVNCDSITNTITQFQREFNKLLGLKFYASTITTQDLETLHQLPLLQELDLYGKFIDDATPNFITKMHLHMLSIGNAEHTQKTFKNLESLLVNTSSTLQTLTLSGLTIEDVKQSLVPGQFPRLRNIEFHSCDINKNFLAQLFLAAPSLESVKFGSCILYGDWMLTELQLTKLKNLVVTDYNCHTVSKDLRELLQACSALENLTIRCYALNLKGFAKFAPRHFKNLTELRLDQCEIPAEDFTNLLHAAQNLKSLYLGSHCKVVGEVKDSLNELTFKQLTKIVVECNLLSDLSAILKQAPHVISLSMHFDKEIVRNEISKHLKALKQLTVSYFTGSIDEKDMTQLALAAPNLRILGVKVKLKINWSALKNQFLKVSTFRINEFYARDNVISILDAMPSLEFMPNAVWIDPIDPTDLTPAQIEKIHRLGFNFKRPDHSRLKPNKLHPSFFETRYAEPILSYTEYFPGVDPRLYRISYWEPNLDSLDAPPKTFMPEDLKEIQLDDRKPDEKYVPGIKPVNPTQGTEILLPALGKKIWNLKIVDEYGYIIELQKIKYSDSTQFYCVTLKKAGFYTIFFESSPLKTNSLLSQDLQRIQNKYNVQNKLFPATEKTFESLGDFAGYIQYEYRCGRPIGDCKQVSIAAYAEIKSRHRYPVRIRLSDVHALLEVYINGDWEPLELGGGPAVLKKIPITIPEEKGSIVHSGNEAKSFSMEHVSLDVLFKQPFDEKTAPKVASMERKESKPVFLTNHSLVLADSELELHYFYQQLTKQYKREYIHVIHSPGGLSLTLPTMGQNGEIKPTNFFKESLDRFEKHSDQPSVICIDIRNFQDEEIPQLNDILDGEIENRKLPKNTRLIVIDQYQRNYGPDFRRRVPQVITIPRMSSMQILPEKEGEHKDAYEINLFESPFWEWILLGTWSIRAHKEKNKFSFYWKPGQLFQALKFKHIVFKNPPLKNRDFNTFIVELLAMRRIYWSDQITTLGEDIQLHRNQGYALENFPKISSLQPLTGKENAPKLLTNGNILDFIQDQRLFLSEKANVLELRDSFLTLCQKESKRLDVICSPDLTSHTLWHFLTEVQEQGLHIRFLTHNPADLPTTSPLKHLFPSLEVLESKEAKPWQNPHVNFIVSKDMYCTANLIAHRSKDAHLFDISTLEVSELTHVTKFDDVMKATFMKTGQLTLEAEIPSLIACLKAGKPIILYGKIPAHLHDVLASLTLINALFTGQLTVIASPEDAAFIMNLTGQLPPVVTPSFADKKMFLKHRYSCYEDKKDLNETHALVLLEKEFLQAKFLESCHSLPESKCKETDEQRANHFDAKRLRDTLLALSLSPWGMIEGVTGIGKTEFLNTILPKKVKIVWTLPEWLTTKPKPGATLVLIMDEANFLGQLAAEGDNFMARFMTLKNTLPGFLWKGKFYELTSNHKVLFSFNPANYGGGRDNSGFIENLGLFIPFQKLPDYYIRARVIKPLLKELIYATDFHSKLTDLMLDVYNWITQAYGQEVLISAREIKCMIYQIASQIEQHMKQSEVETIAKRVVYSLGRQTLCEFPHLLKKFDKQFSVADTRSLPVEYAAHQRDAYFAFEDLFKARQFLCYRHSLYQLFLNMKISCFILHHYKHCQSLLTYFRDQPVAQGIILLFLLDKMCKAQSFYQNMLRFAKTDMGLGGVMLEGASGIGKSRFTRQWIEIYKRRFHKEVQAISASTPYTEKEKLLCAAESKGNLVKADEFNTALWPNKTLNNFLMGLDAQGKRPSQTPGLLLFATQNGSDMRFRSAEDPAIRRRMIKLKLNWSLE